MHIVPAIDVLDGRVVRLLRGDYSEVTEYDEDPAAVARTWADRGAGIIHVVDLDGARQGRPDRTIWQALSGSGVAYQVGGGIRTPADAVAAISAGAARAVVGTAAVWEGDALATMVERVGGDRIVAALDVRDGRALGAGWLDRGRDLDSVVDQVAASGVGRVLVTSIVRDGTMAGPDLDLLARVSGRVAGMRIVASGGVGSLEHIAAIAGTGAEAVIVGRALYEGRFTLAEAQAAAVSP